MFLTLSALLGSFAPLRLDRSSSQVLAAQAQADEDAPADEAMADDSAAADEEAPVEDETPAAEDADAGQMDAADPADEAEAPAPPAPARRAPAKPAADAEEAEPAIPNDPAVLAVLESHPSTPAELLRAIGILADLGYPQVAKGFVDELTGRKLDLAAKAALAGSFQSARLMKLARNAELAPVLGPFIDDLFASAENYRRDPARLQQWAQQLSDPEETVRAQAAVALLRAGEAAVAPLVAILADPKRRAEHANARQILVRLGDRAVAPLLGALGSPDQALKTQIAIVLGDMQAGAAVPLLLAQFVAPSSSPQAKKAAAAALGHIGTQAPDRAEALRLLERAARRPLEQSRADENPPSQHTVWHWDAKQQQSVPTTLDASGAALATAERLAQTLHEAVPEDGAYRRLYALALLENSKRQGGLDKPLPQGEGTPYAVAAAWGPDVLDDVLATAIAENYLSAATAAAQILGDIGTADLLDRGTNPSPLSQAARHADRRLRATAIQSILQLHPTRPFAGSSHVADGLGFFASSYGTPRVLIVHPLSREAQKVAGLAREAGYEADIATNGRQAFDLAVRSPDYEFILIHSAIDRPPVDELLAQFRRDRRTSPLPVGIMAPWEDLERMRKFTRDMPRTETVLQPQHPPEMQITTEQLLERAGRGYVPAAERKTQAIAALEALATLGESNQRLFDLIRQEPAVLQVLYVPELTARAVTVLARLGTSKSQSSLLELADQGAQPLVARQAAVAALDQSIRKFGILLTRDEVLHQYDLYNANAGRDPDTHQVLEAVIDALERDTKSPSADRQP